MLRLSSLAATEIVINYNSGAVGDDKHGILILQIRPPVDNLIVINRIFNSSTTFLYWKHYRDVVMSAVGS